MPGDNKIIVLIDMDCFYVQVEQRLNPSLKGKPCAVVQYNAYRGGGIIAVSYEARASGVTRQMRGEDAKEKCPDILLVSVPEVRGKADLTKYREAGAEVLEVITQFSSHVERASIDEAYIDITNEVETRLINQPSCESIQTSLQTLYQQNFICGYDSADTSPQQSVDQWMTSATEEEEENVRRLIIAGCLVHEIRSAIAEKTGFRCSAGISYNKVLAKLACGLHKPNKQTIVPTSSVPQLFETVSIKSVRNLGGKLGNFLVKNLNLSTMADIRGLSLTDLTKHFGEKTANWLYQLSRGIDHEAVTARQLAQSIGCSKNFPGKQGLDTREKVKHWLLQLATEVVERLLKDEENNKRRARGLTISVRLGPGQSYSRAVAIGRLEVESVTKNAFAALAEFNRAPSNQSTWSPPLLSLSMVAGKFQSVTTIDSNADIKKLLSNMPTSTKSSTNAATNKKTTASGKKDSSISKDKNLKSYFPTAPKYHQEEKNDLITSSSLSTAILSSEESNCGLDVRNHGVSNHSKSITPSITIDKSCSNHSKSITPSITIDKSCSNHSKSITPSTIDKFCSNHSKSITPSFTIDKSCSNHSKSTTPSITIDKSSSIPTKIPNSTSSCYSNQSSNCESFFLSILGHKAASSDSQPCSSTSLLPASPQFCESDYLLCEKCDQKILNWDMPEHSDFHFAQQMQKEFNSSSQISRVVAKSPQISSTAKSASSTSSGKRRGRPSGTKSHLPTKASKLTIDKFFAKV